MNNETLDTQDIRERPPRYLSLLTQVKLIFGGVEAQMGSIFFWFGMIFVLIFVGQSELMYLFSFDGDWIRGEGLVSEISEASVEINEEEIYNYTFSFSIDGQSIQGTSSGVYNGLNEGDITAIEYKEHNPTRARILGTSTALFPVWVGFILIFPLIGLIFMIIGYRNNIKALRLIKSGKFTRGRMLKYEATNTEINGEQVYAYDFEFNVGGKTYVSKCKTHLANRVEDEELEKILYNTSDPNDSIVYDAYTTAPKIDKFGKLEQAGISALTAIFSTVLGLLVNLLIFSAIYTL